MGFSIKIAPGVRVRASSRGVRTSIGPRAARLHVGGGRTGFSTGVGPVGYYTTLGGGSRGRRSTAPRRPSAGSYQRQLAASSAAAAKAEEAQRLAGLFQGLLDIHREAFQPAQPPVAPPPPAPDADAIRAHHRKGALAGDRAAEHRNQPGGVLDERPVAPPAAIRALAEREVDPHVHAAVAEVPVRHAL